MSVIYEEDEEETPTTEILLDPEDTGELSLEDIEEEEWDVHRVLTFNATDDGESYFDGAYFDE